MQITVGLLGEGEFSVVSKINNALIAAGYTQEAAAVGGVLHILAQAMSAHCGHQQAAHVNPGLYGISGAYLDAGPRALCGVKCPSIRLGLHLQRSKSG